MNSIFLILLLLISPTLGLNLDGTLLLSFKYSILSDPLSVLDNWDYNDDTPCLWTGVTCANVENTPGLDLARVITLSLPNSKLLGTIPEDLGFIPHLQTVDLSNNVLNGPLPQSLFNAPQLQVMSLSNNAISGVIPEFVSGPNSALRLLNLSGNALAGEIPQSIASSLQKLSVVSLRSNRLTGRIPIKIQSFEFLDLSSNSLNGSLPLEFGGENLNYLNLSSNKLSGPVPPEFALKIPENSTIDLSFNDLSGEIPALPALSNQKTESFAGNINLCGKPLKKLCMIPSTLSTAPNPNANTSSPAIAVLPKAMINPNIPLQDSSRTTPNAAQNNPVSSQHGLKPGAIAGIAIGPLALIGFFAMLCLYNRQRGKNAENNESKGVPSSAFNAYVFKKEYSSSSSAATTAVVTKEPRSCINLNITTTSWPCLGVTKNGDDEHMSEASIDREEGKNYVVIANEEDDKTGSERVKNVMRSLVMVDGETELELETLFKASAYVLGSSGPSIVYKAVLQDGAAFAVRRIGEGGHESMKEFESRVREVAKMRHPNLVRVRGFCWGDDDEKLVIYDYVSNGSLANVGYRKIGSSPYHLPFETRLKIAKGVARGLTYIHDKKNVHGNIKPSNILLTPDMEPVISDFGLQWIMHGKKKKTRKPEGLDQHFGSKGSITSPHDDLVSGSPNYTAPVGFVGCTSPYHAPEAGDTLKPNPKWDVYSFGVLLLELLTGKVFSDRELSQCEASSVADDPARVLRMVDPAIRGDVAVREEATLAWFKLGFRCAALAPQKRPRMRDALHVLEKSPMFSLGCVVIN